MEFAKFGGENRIIKIVSTIAFIFIAISLDIIAKTSPTVGYEVSIYNAYPSYFWFLVIASIACGIGILLYQAFAQEKSRWWVLGLVIIILVNTIFLLMPEFRGYSFYARGEDTLTHAGYIRDILNTGHVGESNYYPIEHILGTNLIQVSGISLEDVSALFFVLFSGMYIITIYPLAKSTSKHSGQVLLIVAFASPLIYSFFHVNISPNIFSLFMLPCLLYFYHKRELIPSNRMENTIAVLILAFCIVFFHAVTTLFTIIVFFVFGLAYALYSNFIVRRLSEHRQYGIVGKNFLRITFILFIAFFMWYFSYSSICNSFRRVADWLIYQIGTPLFDAQLETLRETGPTWSQTFELFVNRYGAIFLLLLLSSICCIYVIRKSLSKAHNIGPMMFTYAIQFTIALFISVIMLFGYFFEYNPVRVFRLPLLMGTILSGLVVYDFVSGYTRKKSNKRNKLRQRLFIIVIWMTIMVMVTLSFGSVYNSPRVYLPNSQTTSMDLVGTEWLDKSKSPDIRIIVSRWSAHSLHRFEDYNFGIDSSPTVKVGIIHEYLPSHFGYGGNSSVVESLGFRDMYVVIFQVDKVITMFVPENVGSNIDQWTEEDFAKLKVDPTAVHVYANGEFDVWGVYGEF
mgnify:CR=1 FL=1